MDAGRAAWRKSSRSSGNGGNCVELADLGVVVGVRDSKDPDGGHLDVSRDALRSLLADLKQR
ncbi:DUF397 domain-containing protein [Actinomadura sp. LD22]|uniref:DUF397 domain-containing protein n=1 Tax=Actinomadura physcomitrii TaxID=2650748 RepID=A0A6I4M3K4_9ACTN|nr:DUF397 domain-containing protein [Actinomadura physcomitrii]MVZ98913.1 DUF397 domain-containing protein [Actinomadura physcomitrii]